jgi:hypothetical protein
MRLAAFRVGSSIHPGLVVGDEIVDLDGIDPKGHASWVDLLERGDDCLEQARRIADSGANRIPLDSVGSRRRCDRGSSSRSA